MQTTIPDRRNTRSFAESDRLLERALKTIPLGSQTFSKSHEQYVQGAMPQFIARGDGCLVSSAYSDDRDWVATFAGAAAPWAGRLYLGNSKMASQSPGPGTVLPSLLHGGPGRAGGGEELGGERGLHFYMQRCALEGDASVLKTLIG